jgi:hypothetical protein
MKTIGQSSAVSGVQHLGVVRKGDLESCPNLSGEQQKRLNTAERL